MTMTASLSVMTSSVCWCVVDTVGSDFSCPSVALLLVLRAVPTPGGVACHRLCAGQPDRGNRALVVLHKREICFCPEGHRVVDHIRP